MARNVPIGKKGQIADVPEGSVQRKVQAAGNTNLNNFIAGAAAGAGGAAGEIKTKILSVFNSMDSEDGAGASFIEGNHNSMMPEVQTPIDIVAEQNAEIIHRSLRDGAHEAANSNGASAGDTSRVYQYDMWEGMNVTDQAL